MTLQSVLFPTISYLIIKIMSVKAKEWISSLVYPFQVDLEQLQLKFCDIKYFFIIA